MVENERLILSALGIKHGRPLLIVQRTRGGPAALRCDFWALSGRVKMPAWKLSIYSAPKERFMGFQAAGAKGNKTFLWYVANSIAADSSVIPSVVEIEQHTRNCIYDALYIRFVNGFCDHRNITTLRITRNKTLIPAKVAKLDRYLAFHLVSLKCMYHNDMDTSTVEKYDENHILTDKDNGQELDVQGR